ncbi:hypothetical protein P9112_009502 [Eukaryota sp. TZLM1-RC]
MYPAVDHLAVRFTHGCASATATERNWSHVNHHLANLHVERNLVSMFSRLSSRDSATKFNPFKVSCKELQQKLTKIFKGVDYEVRLGMAKQKNPTFAKKITGFRSKMHDAVRDQIYCMFKSYMIESFLEPLLSNLDDEADRNSFDDGRSDVLVTGFDKSMIIIDARSTGV